MSDERELLRHTAELAADYLDSLDHRPVFPTTPAEELAPQQIVAGGEPEFQQGRRAGSLLTLEGAVERALADEPGQSSDG